MSLKKISEKIVADMAGFLKKERDSSFKEGFRKGMLEAAKVANEVYANLTINDDDALDGLIVEYQKETAITIRNCIALRAQDIEKGKT